MFSSSNQTCICGRFFDNAGAFTRHKKSCQEGKKRLAHVLNQAKELHTSRKKRRIQLEDGVDLEELPMSCVNERDPKRIVDGAQFKVSRSNNRLTLLRSEPPTSLAATSQPNQPATQTESEVHTFGLDEVVRTCPF